MRFQPDAVEYRTVITGGTIDLKLSLPLQRRLERDDRSIVCLSRTDLDLRLITRFSFQLTATHQPRSCTIKSNNQPHSQALHTNPRRTKRDRRCAIEPNADTLQIKLNLKSNYWDRIASAFYSPAVFFFFEHKTGKLPISEKDGPVRTVRIAFLAGWCGGRWVRVLPSIGRNICQTLGGPKVGISSVGISQCDGDERNSVTGRLTSTL